MNDCNLTRRAVLLSGMAVTAGMTISFAGSAIARDATLERRKLVVIVARGAMDGLSVAPPLHDDNYYAQRGELALKPAETLSYDVDFGLHPRLRNIAMLASRHELRLAPAVRVPAGIPTHSTAQDVLDSGTNVIYGADTGWLNRALEAMHGDCGAIYVGAQAPLMLRGPAPVTSWNPAHRSHDTTLSNKIAALYRNGDRMLSGSFEAGLRTRRAVGQMRGAAQAAGIRISTEDPTAATAASNVLTGRTVGELLARKGGPQIVTIEIDGWDTHGNQGTVEGNLADRLSDLDDVVGGLHAGLGASWKDTLVITLTEFGRVLEPNDLVGTEHGNAFASLLMGGSLKQGGIIGDWPGLAKKTLVRGALASTLDVRSLLKGVLGEHFGLDANTLGASVFPDSSGIRPVSGLT